MIIAISGKIGSGKDTIGNIIQWLVYRKLVDSGFLGKIASSIYSDYKAFTVTDYHVGWQVNKFATIPSKCFYLVTGIHYHQLEREEKEKIRPLYIDFCEKQKEIFGENVWVDALFNEYKGHTPPFHSGSMMDENCYSHSSCKSCQQPFYGYKRQMICKSCVEKEAPYYPGWLITDLRFPNEMEAIRSRKGITIRVNRKPLKWIDFRDVHFEKTGERLPEVEPVEHYSETALDNAEFDYIIENDSSIGDLIHTVKLILTREKII